MCLVAAQPVGAAEIVQQGFDDFSRGTLGDSGANLYVSHDGKVGVINQHDFNGDGYNDVMFSSDHDQFEIVDAFVYWGGKEGYESLLPPLWRDLPLAQVTFNLMADHPGLTRLPAFGGGKSVIADLNKDGWPDIVFCNYIHNYPGLRTAYVYWGGPQGYQVTARTELPTRWAAGVAATDLNGDGYPELIFANQGTEAGLESISRLHGLGSYIYWGSATGYTSENLTEVETHVARDVVVADINHDGHPDLAFINNGSRGKDVQVFLGGPDGYENAEVQTVPVPDPTSIRAGDVNRDGFADLVVTASAPAQTIAVQAEDDDAVASTVWVLSGSAQGISADRVIRLPAQLARDSLVADLNADGWPDIAVANSGDKRSPRFDSYVYWGAAEGFSPERRTVLPTLGANGVACADLNGDGHVDLVFANSNDGNTNDVHSYIYWGSATGFASYLRSDLQSFGAVSVNAADLNRDGRPEVVLVNQYSGKFHGQVDSLIYWGNPHHYYSTSSMTGLPGHGAYGTAAADLNGDGWCDIVLCNAYSDGSYVYWGSSEGLSPEHRQTITVGRAYCCKVADLNRDGWLDLVFYGREGEGSTNRATIYWGAPSGYSDTNRTMLPLTTRRGANISIADLNRDGYLDLVTNDDYFGTMEILWGSADGYSPDHNWTHATNGGSLKLADLNGDGRLDFIVAGGFDPERKSRNTATRIYWGTVDGTPSFDRVVELEAYQTCEVAVADLNRDGHLDLVAGNYMSDSTRSLPIFVYWGGADGAYSNARRLELPAESSCGVQPLDLNEDAYPEIIVHNHLKDGRHTINSYIYWSRAGRFDRDDRTELPTLGPHFTMMTDAGNLYTRKLEETYVSAPIELAAGLQPKRLTWEGEEPHGAKLQFQVRSAAEAKELDQAEWQPVNDGKLETAAKDRWMQYRVLFTSPDAAAWPVLKSVHIQDQ